MAYPELGSGWTQSTGLKARTAAGISTARWTRDENSDRFAMLVAVKLPWRTHESSRHDSAPASTASIGRTANTYGRTYATGMTRV